MKTYTVKQGDTMSGIAREYLGSANEYLHLRGKQRSVVASRRDQAGTDTEESRDGQTAHVGIWN
jgi:hypothetical protein